MPAAGSEADRRHTRSASSSGSRPNAGNDQPASYQEHCLISRKRRRVSAILRSKGAR
jgi:hypothetical protein